MLWVLVHELAHVLGMSQLGDSSALMLIIYGFSNLNKDDINAVQYLYEERKTLPAMKIKDSITTTPKKNETDCL